MWTTWRVPAYYTVRIDAYTRVILTLPKVSYPLLALILYRHKQHPTNAGDMSLDAA